MWLALRHICYFGLSLACPVQPSPVRLHDFSFRSLVTCYIFFFYISTTSREFFQFFQFRYFRLTSLSRRVYLGSILPLWFPYRDFLSEIFESPHLFDTRWISRNLSREFGERFLVVLKCKCDHRHDRWWRRTSKTFLTSAIGFDVLAGANELRNRLRIAVPYRNRDKITFSSLIGSARRAVARRSDEYSAIEAFDETSRTITDSGKGKRKKRSLWQKLDETSGER